MAVNNNRTQVNSNLRTDLPRNTETPSRNSSEDALERSQERSWSNVHFVEKAIKASQEVQRQLNAGVKKEKVSYSMDVLPSTLFNDSTFWNHSGEHSMENWDYALSRRISKHKILDYVYMGTRDYALVQELGRGDYRVLPESYYSQKDPDFQLVCKTQEMAQLWQDIKTKVLGNEHERVPITRVISIVRVPGEAAEVQMQLSQSKPDAPYQNVKKHKWVYLRDLPEGPVEKEEQFKEWKQVESELPEIFEMIDQAIAEKEPVLIHCTFGRHRSAAITAAYIVARSTCSVKEAIEWIQSHRRCAIHYEISEFSNWLDEWANNYRRI